MKGVAGFVLVVLVLFPPAASAAPQAAPIPPFDFDNVGAFRAALEASNSLEAQRIKAELAGAPAELARSKAAAVSVGIPLTPPPFAHPQSENAYPLYQEWYYNKRWGSRDPYPFYADPMMLDWSWTPAEIAAEQKIFNESPERSALLMQAVDKPYFSPPESDQELFDKAFVPVREATRVLQTESTLLFLKGKVAGSIVTELSIIRISKQAQQLHSLDGLINAAGIEDVAFGGLTDILCHTKPNLATANIVASSVRKYSVRDSLRLSLIGEVSSFLREFDQFRYSIPVGASNHAPKLLPEDAKVSDEVLDVFKARAIDSLISAVKASDDPISWRHKNFIAIDSRANNVGTAIECDPVTTGPFSLGTFAFYAQLDENQTVRLAGRSVLLAACNVLATKARTGRYPARLHGYYPDPFSGKNVIYRPSGTGFVIYSVGASGKFDGSLAHKRHGDRYFVYPAQKAKPLPSAWLSEKF